MPNPTTQQKKYKLSGKNPFQAKVKNCNVKFHSIMQLMPRKTDFAQYKDTNGKKVLPERKLSQNRQILSRMRSSYPRHERISHCKDTELALALF